MKTIHGQHYLQKVFFFSIRTKKIVSNTLSKCTWFLKYLVRELDLLLNFLFISNWIFAGYTGSKNQDWNRQKVKFKNQFRELKSEINEIIFSSPSGKMDTDFFRSCLIFVGSSPTWGDIFFMKSDIKWAFLHNLIY